jgi:hypothetical protein
MPAPHGYLAPSWVPRAGLVSCVVFLLADVGAVFGASSG